MTAPHPRKDGLIRIGIGGWTFEPWRNNFYPADLPQKQELHYASRQVTAIEINSTYYGPQKPATFAKWRDDVPDDFVFSVKALRYCTNRRVLAEAGESIERFVNGGLVELGNKLGPLVWQFAPTKTFDPDDFEAFLKLLPAKVQGQALRHVLEVRHESFMNPDYLALARHYNAATVFTDSEKHPSFADLTADFVYTRLMRSSPDIKTGYAPAALSTWAKRAESWADGSEPDDLPRVEKKAGKSGKREVFIYFIDGAKEHAPAAAMTLLSKMAKTGK